MGGRPRARAGERRGRGPGRPRSCGGDGAGGVEAAGRGRARGAAAAGARPVPAPPAALPGAHQGGHQEPYTGAALERTHLSPSHAALRTAVLITYRNGPPSCCFLLLSDYISVHSGILSALGNFLAQLIVKKREKENSQKLDVIGPLRYAIYGFFFTGPLSHFFYVFMEHWIPSEVPLAGLKRLLLDRLLFAPAFLLLFFLIMNFLETDHGYVGRTCWATGRRRLDTTRHLLQNIFYVSWPLLPASSPVTVILRRGSVGFMKPPMALQNPVLTQS
uniref:peroxisomal membrane protein 2 isoform X2 n=1 Tax=Halichoerus grypus TaxID=9711 RepID=UPI001659DB73|nr:peroxisomal membrane protein 2 isoform X2 [Halichoerus grypus]